MKVVMLKCRQKDCGSVAKVMVITTADKGDALTAYPVCVEHGPEAAASTASAFDENEFLIVTLPEFGVGGLT